MKIKHTIFLCLIFSAASLLNAQENESTKKLWFEPGQMDSLVVTPVALNSGDGDYSPIMFNDYKIYFTSDRRTKQGDKAELAFNEKIYTAEGQDSNFTNPLAYYYLNSDDQSALAGVSLSGGKLFIYKTFGNGDFYYTLKEDSMWTKPKHLKYPINSYGHEQSIAEEKGIMVISSDRNSADGNHDILWAKSDANGVYSEFKAITTINTAADEVDVRLNKDGTKIYFSSNGWNEAGNYDIFYTELNELGEWMKPIALPEPINTTGGNDRYFFDCDSVFYMSSDRYGGKPDDDILFGHLVKSKRRPIDSVALDTALVDTNRYAVMDRKLDSAGYKKYYARVQIGAFYNRSVETFKKHYPSLKNRDIYIEKVVWHNGRVIDKFIINQVFKTIQEAAVVQREMWTIHKITDAFVAIYDSVTNERVAIYNTIIGKFIILKGDQKPFYF